MRNISKHEKRVGWIIDEGREAYKCEIRKEKCPYNSDGRDGIIDDRECWLLGWELAERDEIEDEIFNEGAMAGISVDNDICPYIGERQIDAWAEGWAHGAYKRSYYNRTLH